MLFGEIHPSFALFRSLFSPYVEGELKSPALAAEGMGAPPVEFTLRRKQTSDSIDFEPQRFLSDPDLSSPQNLCE
jgi:hypothetical protein